ncbi:MAG: hypothetical protein HC875_31505 [Anaerolineales bacterium]|nr:hypothetical protein [Anaerolineales bacterium]
MKKFTNYQHYFKFFIVSCFALLPIQCGAAIPAPAEPERITTHVYFKPETVPENKLIATETIPLNNCNGNSVLKMDIERSREFVYAVIDKNGYKFGGEYGFLTGLLEEEYSVVDGEKETQTHTLHLETKSDSYVKYTIAWKESWLNGTALIKRNEEVSVPYRVKKGLTLEVTQAEEVDCK